MQLLNIDSAKHHGSTRTMLGPVIFSAVPYPLFLKPPPSHACHTDTARWQGDFVCHLLLPCTSPGDQHVGVISLDTLSLAIDDTATPTLLSRVQADPHLDHGHTVHQLGGAFQEVIGISTVSPRLWVEKGALLPAHILLGTICKRKVKMP